MFFQRRREVHAWYTHVGRDTDENAPPESEATAAGPCPYLAETAARHIRFEKHLGPVAFGGVIQVVCTLDGSPHAVKSAKHVSRKCVYSTSFTFGSSLMSLVAFFMQACFMCQVMQTTGAVLASSRYRKERPTRPQQAAVCSPRMACARGEGCW